MDLPKREIQPRNVEALFLLIIDVNKFKSINDVFGHIVGDNAT